MNLNPPSTARERIAIAAICLVMAIHVFVFCAAFPFDNNMDEAQHFDLVVKYSHGELPHGLQPMGEEASQYIMVFGSPEYMTPARSLPGQVYPAPFWLGRYGSTAERLDRAAEIARASETWQSISHQDRWTNYESSEQPLYYVCAGLWWKLGQAIGLEGLRLLYWLRFLNVLLLVPVAWLAGAIAKIAFPENFFLRIAVPSIIALFPEEAFYSIENDVLSPLCFGLVMLGLVKLFRADRVSLPLGALIGLGAAASFLVKLSNAPMIAVAAAAVAMKSFQLAKARQWRASWPALAVCFGCAAIPIFGWLLWTRHAFGDFTGTAAKLQFITWTHKPFAEWWHHPIFTPAGVWIFASELLTNFWQGDLHWGGLPLNLPVPDAVYVVLSLSFLVLALIQLRHLPPPQRRVLRWSLLLLASNVLFFIYLSISYNFGICPYPSQEDPYFIAGRLILGALIPFLLVFTTGMHSLLAPLKPAWQFLALGLFLAFMLASEIATDLPVFRSQYNWFHF